MLRGVSPCSIACVTSMPKKVISGGQTGVDRAALDVALELGLACGGWCPRGRRAEDGPLPEHYPLQETPTADYPQRTEWNVRDADATLILALGQLDGGTNLTRKLARQYGKVLIEVQLDVPLFPEVVCNDLDAHGVQTLNIAGPRESTCPGIYQQAVDYLRRLLAVWRESSLAPT